MDKLITPLNWINTGIATFFTVVDFATYNTHSAIGWMSATIAWFTLAIAKK